MNRSRTVGAIAFVFLFLEAALAFPVGADTGDDAAVATWEMPALTGEILESAMAEVRSAANRPELEIETIDYVGNLKQLNLTNWVVCDQYPKPGREVAESTKKVYFYVKRPSKKSCWE